MCSEPVPKEFVKATDVLPIVTYGISTVEDLRKTEAEIHLLEKLKRAGLTPDEVQLYRENEAGRVEDRTKIEASVLQKKLDAIYAKIKDYEKAQWKSTDQPSSAAFTKEDIFAKLKDKPITIYPDSHPMTNLKEIEENLFGHLRQEPIASCTKRKKALRRLERNKVRVLAQEGHVQIPTTSSPTVNRPGSLWDVKELPKTQSTEAQTTQDINSSKSKSRIIGPEPKPVVYTIRNNKIMRVEPQPVDQEVQMEEVKAVDIAPNESNDQVLEGTKMSIDDIRQIERFKNYHPGKPSMVIYLKNIAPSVTPEQLALLFNQFALDNGGPVDVRLLAGRMRGQAFVNLQSEDLAIQVLEEVNGTILGGRPIIAQFGKNRRASEPQIPAEPDRNHLFQDENDENWCHR